MKKILVTSYDMEVGGVERSLASMLEHFDYKNNKVDLMLYRHQGDFLDLLSSQVNLLEEQPAYSTFRKSISETFREGHYRIAFGRVLARIHTEWIRRTQKITEPGYYQMQLMWKYVLPYLPTLQQEQEYDVAISYLWPHDFVADKVKAKQKIGWIHTDYSTIDTDVQADFIMWSKFDYIIAVSESCKVSFLQKYGTLEEKVVVIENITSPDFIRIMAHKEVLNPMVVDPGFNLVTVGRLSYQKGLDLAVKALRSLKDKGYDSIKWYIVGYGGDEATLKSMIAEYQLENSFILLGKQTNPYPFMNSCDLYVQPSRYEGKAVTVTEAKILGKPILITDYPTAPSQVEDGVDGVITELSVEGIVAGIERLFLDVELRQRIADQCRASDFSNTYELEKLYNLIREKEGAVSSAV